MSSATDKTASSSSAWRAPSWFISHGGPPTMFMGTHPAYQQWAKLGDEMKSLHSEGKLKGLVFVSAHWQADDLSDGVYVNTDPSNPLIYDFANFPPSFYEVKVASRNPPAFSSAVIEHLESRGIKAVPTHRGPDHGVWVPLKVAFGDGRPDSHSSALPDDLPLVQVSLPRSEDPLDSLRLGRALRGLRDRGFAVVGGGQAVHNLRDFGRRRATGDLTLPEYSKTFPPALTAALVGFGDRGSSDATAIAAATAATAAAAALQDQWTSANEAKWSKALTLDKRADFRLAHPTYEHFLPTLVSLGASFPHESGEEILGTNEGPLAWNMYRWDSQPSHL
ncbi:uncharacterized protein PFL1_06371 [Pseudozyma flocculosa PF-1]|uniref:Extradiol ring-cleavage dioxygenase class III enzyme subunit B domain-containing protein n=2 Tax=Pseudozyma flocculosa TaxID=84751 RepID=A0A5C3F7F2_9BASI|nr:uncharacterized protein PFL1_06371 [Pseudozyma flocculosa PF-1]EPQ26163.1 hypothetical protein PFL1_06371 [Pseudozyma flocculosa PF-1]SPO40413.1 uncharacterized protein PSFLO_05895 [Pseudozyma flocculosa]